MFPHLLVPLPKARRGPVTRTVEGYVYVLSNPGTHHWFKIGYTQSNPKQRAKELQTTGVVFPFKVIADWKTQNCRIFEYRLHKLLVKHRVAMNREFFNAPIPVIKQVGEVLAAIIKYVKVPALCS